MPAGTTETPTLPTPVSRRSVRWFEFQRPTPAVAKIALALAAWTIVIGLWQFAPRSEQMDRLVPKPTRVVETLGQLVTEKDYLADIGQSLQRIFLSFGLAVAVALPIGLLMGAFPTVEAFLNPIVSPFRYLPAPSFIPLLLAWLGTGDEQKIALLFIGVVWFLISLLMDDTKRVPLEFIETARTLGASRARVLLTVILPCALPYFLDSLRQMLAVSWTYLVIAEIVAATDGIGAVMMRARRLVRMDIIMAGILTIGLLGFFSDSLIRSLRWWAFPYLRRVR
jgi:NitT/TauT family transport system permease protein